VRSGFALHHLIVVHGGPENVPLNSDTYLHQILIDFQNFQQQTPHTIYDKMIVKDPTFPGHVKPLCDFIHFISVECKLSNATTTNVTIIKYTEMQKHEIRAAAEQER